MKIMQKTIHAFAVFASALVLSTVGMEALGGIVGVAGYKSDMVLADKGGGSGGSGGGDDKGADDNQTQGNDGQDDVYSFYHLASSAATYFDASQNPDTKVKFKDSGVTTGNAGGMLGYEDSKYDTHHWIGAMTSSFASSSQGHSYQTYENASDPGIKNLYYYTLYGHALEAMGLDSTDSQGGFGAIWRKIGGFFMMVAYTAAISVPLLFTGIAKIMQFLNPFQLFVNSIQQNSGAHEESVVDQADAASKDTQGPIGQAVDRALANARGFVGSLYMASQNIGLFAVLPITLVLGILMWILFNLNLGSILKKTFIRLAVIVIGIPIFADLYTHTLDEFVKISSTDPDANVVLASTFDDFEAWARKTRLAVPAGTQISISTKDHPSGDVIDSSNGHGHDTTDVRNMSLHINSIASNGLISGINSATAAHHGYSDEMVWKSGSLWTDNSNMTASGQQTTAQMGAGFSILGRYLNGADYTAANYETMYKSHIDASKRGAYMKGIKYLATNTNAFSEDGKAYFAGNDSQAKESGTNVTYLHNATPGGLVPHDRGGIVTFTGNGQTNSDGVGQGPYGLSSLALYNYLTTDFSDGSVTVYSPSKISSGYVSKYHHSVNLIGTSTTHYGFGINAFVLFCAIALIGWGYALATLWTTLAREVKILVHVMPAMMGSLRGGAKMITSILVIIAQILVTEFMYQLAMDLLMAINLGTSSVFSTPSAGGTILPRTAMIHIGNGAQAFMQSVASGRYLLGIPGVGFNTLKANELGTFIYLIASTIITAGFAYIALKTRSSFVNAISTTLSDIVDKLFLNGNSNPLAQASPGQGGASSDNDNGEGMGRQALNEGMSVANYANIASMRKNNANGNVNNHGKTANTKAIAKDKAPGSKEKGNGKDNAKSNATSVKNANKQQIGGNKTGVNSHNKADHAGSKSIANNNNAQSNNERNANSMTGSQVGNDGITNSELNGAPQASQGDLQSQNDNPMDNLANDPNAMDQDAGATKGLDGNENMDAQQMSNDELNADNQEPDAIKDAAAQNVSDDLGDPNAAGDEDAQDDLDASAENGSQNLATDQDQQDLAGDDLNVQDTDADADAQDADATNGQDLATDDSQPADAGDPNAQGAENSAVDAQGNSVGSQAGAGQASQNIATDDSQASNASDQSLNAQNGDMQATPNGDMQATPVANDASASAGDASSASNGLEGAVSENKVADMGDPNVAPASAGTPATANGTTVLPKGGAPYEANNNTTGATGGKRSVNAPAMAGASAEHGISASATQGQNVPAGDLNGAVSGTGAYSSSPSSAVTVSGTGAYGTSPSSAATVGGAPASSVGPRVDNSNVPASAEHGVVGGDMPADGGETPTAEAIGQNPPDGPNAGGNDEQAQPSHPNLHLLGKAGVNLAKASVPVMGHGVKNVVKASARGVYGLGKMAQTGSDGGNFHRAGQLMHQTIHPYSAPAKGRTLQYNAKTNEFTGRANMGTRMMANSYNHTQAAGNELRQVGRNAKSAVARKGRRLLEKARGN